MMRVVAVLDLQAGVVVRGRAGRRSEYRPVAGPLTPSARPLDVARMFRERLGLHELYVADLDAIAGGKPDVATYQALVADGFRLQVDAGIRVGRDADVLASAGVARVILGLETLAGPEELSAAVVNLGDRAVFSLDLHAGRPLTRGDWGSTDPWQLATQAITSGVRRVLVLDLARVGEGMGTGTEDLCRRLVTTWPTLEVSAGGGIRDGNDLIRLRDLGISAVLVASALHEGTLTREGIQMIR
jgi:phosphoribosylformimino-5-aminoimidazole carboxamide ribotide isomerase